MRKFMIEYSNGKTLILEADGWIVVDQMVKFYKGDVREFTNFNANAACGKSIDLSRFYDSSIYIDAFSIFNVVRVSEIQSYHPHTSQP